MAKWAVYTYYTRNDKYYVILIDISRHAMYIIYFEYITRTCTSKLNGLHFIRSIMVHIIISCS